MTNGNQLLIDSRPETDDKATVTANIRPSRRRGRVGTAVGGLVLVGGSLLAACGTESAPAPATVTVTAPVTPTARAAEQPQADSFEQFIGKPRIMAERHTVVKQYTDDTMPSVFTDPHTLRVAVGRKIPGYQPDVNGKSDTARRASSYLVDCYVYDKSRAGDTTRGVMYHVVDWADDNPNAYQGPIAGDFTVANTNWNQLEPGAPDLNHRFDPAIQPCPGSDAAPNT